MNHLLLAGASGRLGREILTAGQNKNYAIHCVNRSELGELNTRIEKISANPNEQIIIIDVTLPEGTETILKSLQCIHNTAQIKGMVIGSTGHSDQQLQKISEISKILPIILSTNFSRGVYLFEEILKAKTSSGVSVSSLARQLGFDLSLWESHHIKKKDAPSGTARTLATAASVDLDRVVSTRVGAIVGEHSLLMSQESEELRITHIAHSRRLFAEGALDLCERLFKQTLENKVYNMSDALNDLLQSKGKD
jgi:4-hydroxy-tetrahydrodipicolinate reductase